MTHSRTPRIAERTYNRWREEYGGLKADQAKWLNELEQETCKFKRLVAELSVDKQIRHDIAQGNLSPERAWGNRKYRVLMVDCG